MMPITPNRVPFDLDRGRCRWLYLDGHQVPIIGRSRRRVIVAAFGARYHLSRRRLERIGVDHVDGGLFRVTSYTLPAD